MAIATTNNVWKQKVYLFKSDAVPSSSESFSWHESWCSAHSDDSVDTDNYLMIELPAVTHKGALWVRCFGSPTSEGQLPVHWCPLRDN